MHPPLPTHSRSKRSTAPVWVTRGARFALFCSAVLVAALCAHLIERIDADARTPTSLLVSSLAVRTPGSGSR